MSIKTMPVRMPEELYRKLKVFSATNDVSMNDIICNSLRSEFKISKDNLDLEWDGYKDYLPAIGRRIKK